MGCRSCSRRRCIRRSHPGTVDGDVLHEVRFEDPAFGQRRPAGQRVAFDIGRQAGEGDGVAAGVVFGDAAASRPGDVDVSAESVATERTLLPKPVVKVSSTGWPVAARAELLPRRRSARAAAPAAAMAFLICFPTFFFPLIRPGHRPQCKRQLVLLPVTPESPVLPRAPSVWRSRVEQDRESTVPLSSKYL